MSARAPLRADAVRNHERILLAAEAAFAELGPGAALDEVARRAGVGVATVYRRFGTRDGLVRAVLVHAFRTEVAPALCTATDDPWADLVGALEATVKAFAARTAVLKLARGLIDGDTVSAYLTALDGPLRRARAAGVVRPELHARDLAAVVLMALAAGHEDPAGGARRRYLALLADGLRPGNPPLPG